MKVNELIEKLLKMPQDVDVVYKGFGEEEELSINSIIHDVEFGANLVSISTSGRATLKSFHRERIVLSD